MTTETTTRPEFVKPDAQELIRRYDVTGLASGYVLDGSKLSNPVKYTFGNTDQADVTQLTGFAAEAVAKMLERYPLAGHNDTTSPAQSAINMARAYFRKMGYDLDTHGPVDPETDERVKLENPSDDAKAFALAMKYFHLAIEWAEAPSLAAV